MKFAFSLVIVIFFLALACFSSIGSAQITGVIPLNFSVYQIISDNSVLITTSVAANNTVSINLINIVHTALDFVSNTSIGNVTIIITRSSTSPVDTNLSDLNVISLKYVNFSVNNTLNSSVLTWKLTKIYYTSAELDVVGIAEDSLAVYWYNSTSAQWVKLTTSINGVFDTGINKIEKYVWVNSTFFSLYAIGGLKTNGQSCSVNAECYSNICCSGACQSSCLGAAVTPSPGAGPGAVSLITPPPTAIVEFVQWPVLREIIPGQSIFLGVLVKNTVNSTLSDLMIESSGVPVEWVSISPSSLTLGPYEKKGFNIAITVPSGTLPGDYKVTIKVANEEVHAENFFILRVRLFTSGQEQSIIIRTVDIDRGLGKTKVELIVNNPEKNYTTVEVIEKIPKELANTSDEIEFTTSPTEILSKDPLVQWNLLNLLAGEKRTISYSVSKILEEFTKYIYWPLEQVNLITTKLSRGLMVVDVKIPAVYVGRTSQVAITIENLEPTSYKFNTTIELPIGWKIKPSYIEDTIGSGQRKILKFNVFVPSDAEPGTYILRLYLGWDGSEMIKEYPIMVNAFPIRILYYAVVGLGITVFLYLAVRYHLKKRHKPKLLVAEKMRRIRRQILRRRK